MKVEVVCPNCGSHQISSKWIPEKDKLHPEYVSFEAYAKNQKPPDPNIWTVSDNYFHREEYIQLVVSCENCGYTEVFPTEKITEKIVATET